MRVQGQNLLVEPEKAPEKKGNVILTPSQQKTSIGKVLEAGPGCEQVRIGDRIQYTPKRASVITIEGEEKHFISESEVAYIY